MKTIIFADTHLTGKFERRKFEYLKRIISEADKVIINGDFWDGYLCKFDKFVNSKWSQLFAILKSRSTVYLYGNHDKKKMADERVYLFSNIQDEKYKLKIGKYELNIQHGNKIYVSIGDKYPWILNWLTCNFGLKTRDILTRFLGEIFIYNYPIAKKTQKALINWSGKNMNGNEIFVASHSHTPTFDLRRKYINTGFIGQTYASYIEINDGKIELVKERY